MRYASNVRRSLAALFTWAAIGSGCGDDGSVGTLPVEAVEVLPAQASISVGGTVRLTARVLDTAGNALGGYPIRWSSSDSSRAAVSSAGLVTGVAVGNATITASSDGRSGSAQIQVTTGTVTPGVQAMVVAYVTYLGGSGTEQLRDIASDPLGNVYLAGGTSSPDFPVAGAWDGTFNNPGSDAEDVFVTKLGPGGQIIWSTYIGGPNFDRAYAIELAADGSIFVAGRAGAGFPVTSGAFQTGFVGSIDHTLYGRQDGFVCKLTSAGQVDWCSYFGNSSIVPIRDIDVDRAGNVLLMTSDDAGAGGFPQSWFANAFQSGIRGGRDALIVKVQGDGSRVLWATYLGGSGTEQNTNSLRLDPNNDDIYVLIATASADMPTPGGFDRQLSGPSDYFVGKLSSDGSRLHWGTYLGGSGHEWTETHELAIDPAGNAVVSAKTLSDDFPVSSGAVQPTFGGMGGPGTGQGTNNPGDAFAAKISADGSRLLASTFLGGSEGDGGEGAAVDAHGNIYFTGQSYSPDFPVTTDTLSTSFGEGELIAAKLSSDLATLFFSVRIGGTARDEGRTSHVAADGSFYVGGQTLSSNIPTLRALQSSLRGRTDALLVKIVPLPAN
ncbi:MAG: SBBP repeat-containing protein [Longimicrobiales bacterium]